MLGNNLNVVYQFNLKFETIDILFFPISKDPYEFIINPNKGFSQYRSSPGLN